jgi:hypothetical protein
MTLALSGTNGLLQSYDYQVPTTGFSYTFAAGVQTLILNPAATLATGTVTMPAAPADGMVITFSSTKQITSLTVAANSGQTINNAITLLAAGQSASYIYHAASTAWFSFSNSLFNYAVDYLVVAGGGGGGGDAAAGGGAGGLLTSTAFQVTGGNSYAVTVGAGGAGNVSTAQGTSGSNSVFSTVTATGGGGGGGSGTKTGLSGGSGGGGAVGSGTAGSGTSGQGFAGGNGASTPAGGGGGGASAVGSNGSGTNGGAGGAGLAST